MAIMKNWQIASRLLWASAAVGVIATGCDQDRGVILRSPVKMETKVPPKPELAVAQPASPEVAMLNAAAAVNSDAKHALENGVFVPARSINEAWVCKDRTRELTAFCAPSTKGPKQANASFVLPPDGKPVTELKGFKYIVCPDPNKPMLGIEEGKGGKDRAVCMPNYPKKQTHRVSEARRLHVKTP